MKQSTVLLAGVLGLVYGVDRHKKLKREYLEKREYWAEHDDALQTLWGQYWTDVFVLYALPILLIKISLNLPE